jgi:hypothetical protein
MLGVSILKAERKEAARPSRAFLSAIGSTLIHVAERMTAIKDIIEIAKRLYP